MNLIEISEQLKDVPDQLLMKEVQSPSGAYPAYLVVTEMSRRKRMRDQAMKEMPTTSVVQDLTQPSREQVMAAMAAAQRQAAPQMAQPMSQPMSQPRLNAPGIMAAPQAMDTLAAQDVMGAQEPRRMAAGGMVSFAEGGDIKYDDRGVARFQGGAYLFPEGSLLGQFQRGNFFGERAPGSLLGRYQLSMQEDPDVRRRIEEEEERKRQRAENDAELRRIQNRAASTQAAVPIPSPAPVASSSAASTAGGGGAGRGAGGGGGGRGASGAPPAAPYAFTIPAYSSKFADQTREARDALLADQPLTEEQEAAAREKGVAAYKQQVPFRMGFLEQDIAKRQSELEGRRGSNINEAIIQAGLGIMASKSPYFAQAVGEGGMSALGAYRQGLKDIREGEKDLTQSKVSFANAQTLYDQGKFAAADKERQNAIERQQRGFEKKSSLYATFTKETQMELDAHRSEVERVKAIEDARQKQQQIDIEREKLPATIEALRGQAAYYRSMPQMRGGAGRLSDADQKAAEEAANQRAIADKTVQYGTEAFIARRNQYYLEELQRRAAGLNYQPGGVPPAGTGAEFIGFR